MAPKQNRAAQLTEYIRRHCGEHLSAQLLAGYGEAEAGQRRMFLIKLKGEHGLTQERYVEVLSGPPTSLPYGQDPLVLVALIRLLFGQGEVTEERCAVT